MGDGSDATGNYSHATNRNTTAGGTCSSAMGEGTEATGTAAHAQGMFTDATGTGPRPGVQHQGLVQLCPQRGVWLHCQQHRPRRRLEHPGLRPVQPCLQPEHGRQRHLCSCRGEGTEATADASASEGYYTVASGFAGHAEGYQTTASAYASSAGGYTVADQVYQTAVGKYNSAAQTGVLFAVGNGTAIDMRSDALQIHEMATPCWREILSCRHQPQDTLANLNSRITALEAIIEALVGEITPAEND